MPLSKARDRARKKQSRLESKNVQPNCNHCWSSDENDLCDKGHNERQSGQAGYAVVCPDIEYIDADGNLVYNE